MTQTPWTVVSGLLQKQDFGVLGTTRQGHAYASLVAFVASADAHELYFATTRSTRKYHNLAADAQVALLIDNRADESMPLYEAAAVTAYGRATELPALERQSVQKLYLAKHPQLKSFVSAPSSALFRIRVEDYHLVRRFQHVTEFQMAP